MKKIQLLAPAGSLDILKTAVHAGADAIYVGGSSYSARAGAKNFTIEELREGVEYARFFNRQLYIATNTLIKTDELKQFIEYLEVIAVIAPDALIVQDLGVAKLIKQYVPELPIHASTQLTVTNSYGVAALKELAFKRVVVARELTLQEIAEIVQAHPEIEIETFIHGAQCFCYSGQCLMSSMIGERSGNRGQCAQPCRLPYQLGNNTGTLISPKDLYGLPLVKQAIEAGIHTLKIEGRLKNRDYVYNTVASYREVIDNIYDNKKDNLDRTTVRIAQTFNREFCDGYLSGNLGQALISKTRHNNKGIQIGTIDKHNINNNSVTLKLTHPLSVGDGVYIESKTADGVGFTVNKITIDHNELNEAEIGQKIQLKINSRVFIEKITKGSIVYKSFDIKLSREIAENDQPTKIAISFKIIAELNKCVVVEYRDKDGITGKIEYAYIVEKAERHPITYEAVKKQLSRLGNTWFYLEKVELVLPSGDDVIVPLSVLNELRRIAIEECTQKRKYKKPYEIINSINSNMISNTINDATDNTNNRTSMLIAKINDLDLLRNLPSAYRIVFYTGDWTKLRNRKLLTNSIAGDNVDKNIDIYAVMSYMVKQQELSNVKRQIVAIYEAGVKGFVVNQIGQCELVLSVVPDAKIVFDTGMNVFNVKTYRLLQAYQPIGTSLSLELNKYQLKQFYGQGYVYIHGRYRLMISEHQLLTANEMGDNSLENIQYLQDRKGYQLPSVENEYGQVEIYNSQITSLIDEFSEIQKNNHQGYIVDVSRDFLDNEILIKTLQLYQKAYKYKDLQQLPNEYNKILTKGHYHRGVR